jgi:hypothetical protein
VRYEQLYGKGNTGDSNASNLGFGNSACGLPWLGNLEKPQLRIILKEICPYVFITLRERSERYIMRT